MPAGTVLSVDAVPAITHALCFHFFRSVLLRGCPMNRFVTALFATLLASSAHAAEYMQKTPFQLSRAFSPGVITSGGMTVWVAGQTATEDNEGKDIANNFEAPVKEGVAQVRGAL